MYKLVLKSSDEQIDRIEADSLENATLFFIKRKQMDEDIFHSLYNVLKD